MNISLLDEVYPVEGMYANLISISHLCAKTMYVTPRHLGTQLATYLVVDHVRKRLQNLFYKINKQALKIEVNSHLKTFAEVLNLKTINPYRQKTYFKCFEQ